MCFQYFCFHYTYTHYAKGFKVLILKFYTFFNTILFENTYLLKQKKFGAILVAPSLNRRSYLNDCEIFPPINSVFK